MDNIQKAIVAVLGIAGTIAMLVPPADPVASATAVPAAPVADNIAVPPAEESAPPAPTEYSSFEIGEPAIDGNPIQPDFGMPYGASSQDNASEQSPNEAPLSPVSYVPPAYAHIPGMPGYVAKTPGESEGED